MSGKFRPPTPTSHSRKRRRLNRPSEATLPDDSSFDYGTDDEDLRRFRSILCKNIFLQRTNRVGRPTREVDNPRQNYQCYSSLLLRGESFIEMQHLQTLKKVFREYTGEVCQYSKAELVAMLFRRFTGGPFTHHSRQQESEVLEHYQNPRTLDADFVEMMNGQFVVPRDLVQLILEFASGGNHASLVFGFGLCNSSCYRIVLTTWKILNLNERHRQQVSEVILRSIRELNVIRSYGSHMKKSDWKDLLRSTEKLEFLRVDPYAPFLRCEKYLDRLRHVSINQWSFSGDRRPIHKSGAFNVPVLEERQYLSRFAPNLQKIECSECLDLEYLGHQTKEQGAQLPKLNHLEEIVCRKPILILLDLKPAEFTCFVCAVTLCPNVTHIRTINLCSRVEYLETAGELLAVCPRLRRLGVLFEWISFGWEGKIDALKPTPAHLKALAGSSKLERIDVQIGMPLPSFDGEIPFISDIVHEFPEEVSFSFDGLYVIHQQFSLLSKRIASHQPRIVRFGVKVGRRSDYIDSFHMNEFSFDYCAGTLRCRVRSPETFAQFYEKKWLAGVLEDERTASQIERIAIRFQKYWIRDLPKGDHQPNPQVEERLFCGWTLEHSGVVSETRDHIKVWLLKYRRPPQ